MIPIADKAVVFLSSACFVTSNCTGVYQQVLVQDLVHRQTFMLQTISCVKVMFDLVREYWMFDERSAKVPLL